MRERSEDLYAAIAAWHLGAKAIRRDDGAHQGMRDFDLVFADGCIEPLEITTAAMRRSR